ITETDASPAPRRRPNSNNKIAIMRLYLLRRADGREAGAIARTVKERLLVDSLRKQEARRRGRRFVKRWSGRPAGWPRCIGPERRALRKALHPHGLGPKLPRGWGADRSRSLGCETGMAEIRPTEPGRGRPAKGVRYYRVDHSIVV